MSILNQSITTHGQPAFPPKSSNSQDTNHQLPMAPSLSRSCSLKSYQSTSLKKTISVAASGSSAQGESSCKNTDLDSKSRRQDGMFRSISESVCKLTRSLNNMDCFGLISLPITRIEQGNHPETVSRNTEFEPSTINFLHSLMENEKLNLIKDVMEEPDLIYLDPNHTLVVAVSSAVKLECKQMDQITRKMQRVTGSRIVKLENIIDPSLIAGFVITYEKEGFHVIDLSVKGQLAELAAQIESTDQRSANYGQR